MTTQEHLRMAFTVLRRLLEGFVIYPAGAVGCFLLFSALVGGSPIREVVEGMYEWADTSVRTAPAGHVLTYRCEGEQPKQTVQTPPSTLFCKKVQDQVISAKVAIDQTIESATWFYQVLVFLSFGAMLFARGWRNFLGLPPPSDTPSLTSAKGA